MKLSVFSPVFNGNTLEEALMFLNKHGVKSIEMGTGGFPGTKHVNPDDYLNDDKKVDELLSLLKKYDVEICALSCHGNAIHPDKEIARKFHEDFEKTCKLAKKLGIETIITFSGCPGGSKEDKTPNWITCPWPKDFSVSLDYQWNEVLIPYWKTASEFAKEYGIKKIAFELHPGFCVYNPETLLKLRSAVGDIIGANLDPSHLFWQGIDINYAIRKLGDAIYHFHAKDTKIDDINTKTYGVLDTKTYADEINRSWIFRTVGYGHSYDVWKDIISSLRLVGYNGAISIEHEDTLMAPMEGLTKAIEFLKDVIIDGSTTDAWWV
ncbi:MAG: sugar phosphate isomerase/epimerase [Ruminococcaceae bacterium]|nr:sugar phosphate isomerase/epimerase [Oscillospiraceae bacterium]